MPASSSLAVIVCLTMCAFGTASTAFAATAAPPSLTGEALLQPGTSAPAPGGQCASGLGGTTTYSFDESGFASGPYSGTFNEHVSVTVGPQTTINPSTTIFGFGPFFNGGPITRLQASFRIDSATGVVTGTKELTTSAPSGMGTCTEFNARSFQAGSLTLVGSGYVKTFAALSLTYAARIVSPLGNYQDSGTSQAQASQRNVVDPNNQPISNVNSFGESFASRGIARVLPTTKDECKHGGSEPFVVFNNQGDCVSFVASGGKNQPGGS